MDNTAYKQVRGLMRGLALLRAMNGLPDGRASIPLLCDMTGLHRTTVRRLLETLMDEGYVRRSESDDSFRLLLKVRELSEGFTDVEWVSMVAAPVMSHLLSQVVWPSDLSTPDGIYMQIRETTHRFSKLSFHRAMVGRQLPMLMTASGRAYFANCGEEERNDILQLLIHSDDKQAALARDDKYIRNLIRHTVTLGYGTNQADWEAESKIGAIAVPIRYDGRILGCLNVVYLNKAMTPAEAARKYLAHLHDAATEITRQLSASEPASLLQPDFQETPA